MPEVNIQQPAPTAAFVQPVFNSSVAKEVKDFQFSVVDKAMNYSKVMIGLGFGGFFAAWSGTRATPSQRATLWSVLPITIALVLYVAVEVFQAMVSSHLALKFAKVDAGPNYLQEFRKYQEAYRKLIKRVAALWYVGFPLCVIGGFLGAGVLIVSFFRALLR